MAGIVPVAARTYVALIVAVVALTSMAAVVTPRPSVAPEDPKPTPGEIEIAWTACHRIATAIERYELDTGAAPSGLRGADTYVWLRGKGGHPRFASVTRGLFGEFSWFLQEADLAPKGWAGPYLDPPTSDPWGAPYVAYVRGMWTGSPQTVGAPRCWVLSAGPNGIFDTGPHDAQLLGDDIGASLR